jgi:hypothetical protein
MDTATKIVIEVGARIIYLTLKNPISIGELWAHWSCRARRPSIITLAGGIFRVTF